MTDRLVERIPVYLSQEFAKSLHLIKSPLRDPTRPYDDVGPLQSTTYKLNAQVFEFQHGLNQMDAHYNANAEHHINTMTFQTRPNETRVNHVIGQRIENAYILHPVYKVHTLLPVFKHVDDIQNEYDNDLLGQADEEDQSVKQAQLRVKKPEQLGRLKRVTYDSLQQTIQEERPQTCIPLTSSSEQILDGKIVFPLLPVEHMAAMKEKVENEIRVTRYEQMAPKDRPKDIKDVPMSDFQSAIPVQEDEQFAVLTQRGARAQNRSAALRAELYKSRPLHMSSESKLLTSAPIGCPNVTESISNNSTGKPAKSSQLGSYIAPFVYQVHPSAAGTTDKDPADVRNKITLNNNSNKSTTVEQVLKFMQFARVASFQAIARNLEVQGHDALLHLLQILNSMCFIVHGLFVINSQSVFKPDGARIHESAATLKNKQTVTNHVARLTVIRHYILHQFALAEYDQNDPNARPTINQADISRVVDLGPRDLIPLLQELGVKRVNPALEMYETEDVSFPSQKPTTDDEGHALWELIQPPDFGFQKTFPVICRASADKLNDYILKHYPQQQ